MGRRRGPALLERRRFATGRALRPRCPDEPVLIVLRHAATWRARWGADPDHPVIDRLLGAGVLQRAEQGGYAAV